MTAPNNVNTSPSPSSKPMIKPATSPTTGKPILRERFYDALDAANPHTDEQLSPEDVELLAFMKKSTEPVKIGGVGHHDNSLEVKFYKPIQK